jgi:murein DD-endopeptidase MepM/ murein hydrolase activator NlpD
MRRLLIVLFAALAAVPAAHAWTWPTDGQVLQPFTFDPANPYAAGQHRGIDLGGSPGDAVRAPRAGVV